MMDKAILTCALTGAITACNAGSLNHLKLKDDGQWAWPPACVIEK